MRKVEIEIPDGKMAKWVNGVLTLVDDKKPQNVMERIKTFANAAKAVGIDDPEEWEKQYSDLEPDVLAYFKLRIITKALNEGWKPKFDENERRYYPWFKLKTSRVVGRGSNNENANYGLVYAGVYYASLGSDTDCGPRLAFKSKELAEYAGKQFVEIYEEYCLI